MNVFIDPTFAPEFERAPLTLVDVGASGGIDAKWRALGRHLRVIGFDADARAPMPGDAAGPAVTFLTAALHRERGPLPFHLVRHQEASSVFVPNRQFLNQFPESDRFDIVESITMDADTLDHQLALAGVGGVDFIKLDTQGSELLILQGGRQTLASGVFGLEIEVEFVPVYADQPLFADVDAFARDAGFMLMDLKPTYWKRAAGRRLGGAKGQLIFGDALYFRHPDSLAAVIAAHPTEADRRAAVLHALAVCLIYGYVDVALDTFDAHASHFSSGEATMVRNHLRADVWPGTRLPHFPGRGRVAHWLTRLQRLVQPSHRGWGTSGRSLGNL
jgi:FkbM family methyltransferase